MYIIPRILDRCEEGEEVDVENTNGHNVFFLKSHISCVRAPLFILFNPYDALDLHYNFPLGCFDKF